jgi:hypothetical protein
MNHKRKGPKSTRAGCLMCKPNKHQANKGKADSSLGHRGFGKIRAAIHTREDLRDMSR